MLVALLPGFGRLGYFFSPALREERLLLFIPLDQVSRKLPFRAYSRLHLDALFVYWGLGDDREHHVRLPALRDLRTLGSRIAALGPYIRPSATLLLFDSAILLFGAYIYVEQGRPNDPPLWWFREGGLVAMLDVGQLLVGGVFGVAAYLTFWEQPVRPSRSDAAGIFLWGIGGVGLVIFALDDYFTVHERLGDAIFDLFSFVPVITDVPSDMLVLGYTLIGVTVIVMFRMEVLSGRPSATMLQLAAVASVVMVLTDAFGVTYVIRALEYPAQTFACSLLMLAFAVRWLEVRQAGTARTETRLQEITDQG
jgi:hypothetical protein